LLPPEIAKRTEGKDEGERFEGKTKFGLFLRRGEGKGK